MDTMTSMLRKRPNLAPAVKAKILQSLQDWKYFAEARPNELGYIKEVVHSLEKQGYEFPPPDPNAVAAASVLTETPVAPEWEDNTVCTRCRAEFGTFLRKHHCRNCGRVFCYKCSSKNMTLPWYSIQEPVRVCDGCAKRKGPFTTVWTPPATLSAATQNSKEQQDGDLARAIALSLQEQNQSRTESSGQVAARGEGCDAEEDPDLAAAIAASLKEWDEQQKRDSVMTSPSAPSTPTRPLATKSKTHTHTQRTLEVDTMDLDNILTFSQTVSYPEAAWKQTVPTKGLPLPIQNMQDKASASRGRLVRQLDFGHRRLRELSTLHEKLADIVRMYDQLLDTQFSSPLATYSSGTTLDHSSKSGDPLPAVPVGQEVPSSPPLPHHDCSAGPTPFLPDFNYTQAPHMNATDTSEHAAQPGNDSLQGTRQEEALLIDL